ncbi:putative ancient ubiquitous protein 1-like [Penaeus vannamei]|nr:putative ancient ubiquitous protein 1-like [Penaeus vannamei]
MRRGESESAEEFAARVQVASAASLSVKTTNHTVADKVEFMKRLAREAAAAANPMLSPEVHIMAQQVQEVLPHISLDQIKRDLVRTQNVDQTITNFLEGNVPEPIPEPRPATPSPVVSSPTPPQATGTTTHPHTSSPTNSASKSTLETATSLAGSSEANVSLNTAAKSFGKSATERMTSFQTRKAQLIENARRKYIEKHGLQLPRNDC